MPAPMRGGMRCAFPPDAWYKRRMRGRTSAEVPAAAPALRANRLALLRLALAVLAISFTPVLFRLSEVGPGATAFYRTFLALPIIVGWMLVERRRLPAAILVPRDALTLIVGGVVFAI